MPVFSPLFFKDISKEQILSFFRNMCLFLFLIGLFSGIGLCEVYFICYLNDVEVSSLSDLAASHSTVTVRNCARLLVLISHASLFILPALTFAYLQVGKNWIEVFRFKRNLQLKSVFLSIMLLLAAFPMAQWLYKMNYAVDMPDSWVKTDLQATQKVMQLMEMHTPTELLFNLLIIAIVPAIGEEMIFRGLVQQSLGRATQSHWWAIGVSAVIFSASHCQFLGFLPRVLLGVLLGYIFYHTQNLWYSIIAHGVFNGIQVITFYAMPERIQQLAPSKTEVSLFAAIGSMILMILIGALLRKARVFEPMKP
jgi:uncharacterized protein